MTRVDELRDALTREQRRLRELIDNSSVGQLTTDRYGRVVDANTSAAHIFGLDSLVGSLLPSLVAERDRGDVRAAINRGGRGERMRIAVTPARNQNAAVQLAVTPIQQRERLRWLVRDVTAQHEAQERVRRLRERVESSPSGKWEHLRGDSDGDADGDGEFSFALLANERDQLRALLDRLEQGIIAIDRHLQVEVANDTARRLCGSRLIERAALPEPWPDQVELAELVASLFRDGGLAAEARVVLADGDVLHIHGLPAGGGTRNAVLLITDVSKRERAERVEREFVANASHELRTPLATITGAIEILQSGAKDVPEARDRFLAHIEREVDRLSKLARALLVLARAQAQSEQPRIGVVHLRPLLEEVASVVTPQPGVEVVVACSPQLTARADEDLLLEVVGNLAANAAAHTTEGHIRLAAFAGKRATIVEVRDTGSGIDDETRTHLFERFYRAGGRDTSRFGLGLAIVREAVIALGGEIELESEKGVGTTVRVTLPRVEEAAAA